MAEHESLAAGEIAAALPGLIRIAELNDRDLLAFMLDQARFEAEREAQRSGASEAQVCALSSQP